MANWELLSHECGEECDFWGWGLVASNDPYLQRASLTPGRRPEGTRPIPMGEGSVGAYQAPVRDGAAP